jgi:hypothetical protein
MSVVPKKYAQRVQFFEDRVAKWTANAVAIGTTADKVTALTSLAGNARRALSEQQTAMAAAKAATLAFDTAVKAMSVEGASIIKQVRAKAEVTGDSVYSLAEIPAPAKRSPVGPPGQPEAFKASLDGNGALMLAWKCKNPKGASGTIYQVYRRVGGSGEFTYLGGTGEKKFTDTTLPTGATQVTYQIQAVRSTAVGLWATFNVFFGTNTSGPMVESTVVTTAPRMAA